MASTRRSGAAKGQSIVEMALVLPLLVLLLGVIVDAGLAISAWVRVNTAARDATRFALDRGRPADVTSLVLDKLSGLDNQLIDVFIITGTTDISGNISAWTVDHEWHSNLNLTTPRVQRSAIQAQLQVPGNPQASQNMPFVIVEVDFGYSPLMATLVSRGSYISMMSYAIAQRY